jgi:hypothetical protein
MAVPTITFNSSTGSDTAASGAGPGTALSGNGASLNSTSTVTLSANTPNLSGVATDGTAVLWVDTTSGRQYSKISSVNDGADTVTCEDAFGVTESGRNWGIGGKRATLDHADSRTLINSDIKPGWIVSLEDNQTISSALAPTVAGDTTTGKIQFISSVPWTPRTITQSANAAHFTMGSANNNHYVFQDLNFANSNGTKTGANAFAFSGSGGNSFVWMRCSTDATNVVLRFANRSASSTVKGAFIGCTFRNCTSNAINLTSSFQNLAFYGCEFIDNGAAALTLDQGTGLIVANCIFDTTTGDGLVCTGAWSGIKFIVNNVFYTNTDGFDFSANATFAEGLIMANNIFKNNTTGVRGLAVADAVLMMNDYNDYHGNGTARTNLSAGGSDLALDPQFTNAGSGDFSIGVNLKAMGWPGALGVTGATIGYTDIGVAQRQESSGGGMMGLSLIAGGT